MDHDEDNIPTGILEHYPKYRLSGAEFKEATEENSHEQENVNRLSRTEFKGNTEEKKSVRQNVQQLNRAALEDDIKEKQSVPLNVKELNRAGFEEDVEETQNVPQIIKELNRTALEDDIEEKQSVTQNVKELNRAGFEEDVEETQSMPQNVQQLNRTVLEDDIKEKQNVQQLIELYNKVSYKEDVKKNPNECQIFLDGNPKEKRTERTQIRTSQSCIKHRKFCWCFLVIGFITILLFISFTFNIMYVYRAKNCDLNSCSCSCSPCPHYWIGYEGKCYFISREKQTWTSSQNFCSSYNSSLARIESEEDKDFVMIVKGKGIYWIGLQRLPGQPWVWTNGEISRLAVTEGGGNCAYLDNESKAVSSGCHKVLPWICSKPATYT